MKNKFLAAFGLTVCLAMIGVITGREVAARLIPLNGNAYNQTTNPPTADLWCNGGQLRGGTVVNATELCQDYLGDFLPTTTNNQSLGTASLVFSNAYLNALTVSGQGGVSLGGNVTVGTNNSNTFTIKGSTIVINNQTPGVVIGTSPTDATFIMYVDGANRRVGIGGAPTNPLSVTGAANVTGALTVSGSGSALLVPNGNVGINQATPTQKLNLSSGTFLVNGSGAGITIDDSANNPIQYFKAGGTVYGQEQVSSNVFYIDSSNSNNLELNTNRSGNVKLAVGGGTVYIGTMTVSGATAPPNSQALCLSGGQLGHCTSVVGAAGGCTCVAP